MNYSIVKEFARELRKNQTEAEKLIWREVRNRKFLGHKFTRQFIIEYKISSPLSKYFIVDFYCHEKKLVLEIDGEYHKYQLSADKEREEIIKAYGLKVVRFSNREVLENIQSVKKTLKEKLEL